MIQRFIKAYIFLSQYIWKMIDTDKEECGERLAEKTQKIQKKIGKKSVK